MYDPYNPYEDKSPKIEVDFKRNRISTKKSGIGTVNAGGAIIIIIFVVLCLTIFGLLSFTTSFADKKLADKNRDSLTQYYKADSEAEKKLAMIFQAVNEKIQKETNFTFNDSFVQAAISKIQDGPGEADVWEPWLEDAAANDDISVVTVFYRTDLDAAQDAKVKFYLNSEVELYYNKNRSELTYKISEWKVSMISEFVYDEEQLNVWQGFN